MANFSQGGLGVQIGPKDEFLCMAWAHAQSASDEGKIIDIDYMLWANGHGANSTVILTLLLILRTKTSGILE